MKIQPETCNAFNGSVYKINKFSQKPHNYFNKMRGALQELVQKKDYNIFIRQNYSSNIVEFIVPKTKENIEKESSTISIKAHSKLSKYLDAAKNAIDKYEQALLDKDQQEWGKKYDKQEWEEMGDLFAGLALFPLLMIIGALQEGIQETGKIFKQLVNKAKKFAVKKG